MIPLSAIDNNVVAMYGQNKMGNVAKPGPAGTEQAERTYCWSVDADIHAATRMNANGKTLMYNGRCSVPVIVCKPKRCTRTFASPYQELLELECVFVEIVANVPDFPSETQTPPEYDALRKLDAPYFR